MFGGRLMNFVIVCFFFVWRTRLFKKSIVSPYYPFRHNVKDVDCLGRAEFLLLYHCVTV